MVRERSRVQSSLAAPLQPSEILYKIGLSLAVWRIVGSHAARDWARLREGGVNPPKCSVSLKIIRVVETDDPNSRFSQRRFQLRIVGAQDNGLIDSGSFDALFCKRPRYRAQLFVGQALGHCRMKSLAAGSNANQVSCGV